MPKQTRSRKAAEQTVTSREARRLFGELLSRAQYTGERIAITRNGRVVAGLVGPEELELLRQRRPPADPGAAAAAVAVA